MPPKGAGFAADGIRRGVADRPGVSMKIDGFPPPFSFWGAKKKMAVEPSKEKTLIAAQLRARSALPRSGMRL